MIEVRQSSQGDPIEFEVIVHTDGTSTRHWVTVSRADCDRLGGGSCSQKRSVEAAFRFLLEREPKEAVLRRFNISDIQRYFPEFTEQLPKYLPGTEDRGEDRHL